MSNQITTAFVQQYSSNVQMLSQQMGSYLRSAVDVETIVGKNAFFDQVGKTTAVLRTSRHADTPQIDTPHSRRRVSLADYEWADLIDYTRYIIYYWWTEKCSSEEEYLYYSGNRIRTIYN